MNWVDIVIVVIVALSTLSSLRRGFVRQALGLIGFIVGIYAALSHHQTLARALAGAAGSSTMATMVAFVLVLLAVWVAFAALGAITYRALKAIGLEWADHAIGMLVGLLIGLFVTVCFLLLFIRIPVLGISDAIRRSILASYIFEVLPHLKQLLPSDLRLFRAI